MQELLTLTADIAQQFTELMAESQILIDSLASVVSMLTQIASSVSQAVEFMASLLGNVSAPM